MRSLPSLEEPALLLFLGAGEEPNREQFDLSRSNPASGSDTRRALRFGDALCWAGEIPRNRPTLPWIIAGGRVFHPEEVLELAANLCNWAFRC